MTRCIITPTYSKHFPYIVNYLKSFNKYLLDREFPIFFVVDRAEKEDLIKIVKEYGNGLNVEIVEYENVLESFNIQQDSASLLSNLGRISFQTVKKFYSAVYINFDQFLVLDSESIMIKYTNMNQLFEDYFKKPSFYVSKLSDRPAKFKTVFTYGFMQSASLMTGYPIDYWPLESYNWFLELRVLKKMIAHYGDLCEGILHAKLPVSYKDEGVEGELLYYPYIIYTPGQFGYTILNTISELKKYLGWIETSKFKYRFHRSWRSHGGYLEGLLNFVTQDNIDGLCVFMENSYLPILRVSRMIGKDTECMDINCQRELIKRSPVNILASSYPDRYLREFEI